MIALRFGYCENYFIKNICWSSYVLVIIQFICIFDKHFLREEGNLKILTAKISWRWVTKLGNLHLKMNFYDLHLIMHCLLQLIILYDCINNPWSRSHKGHHKTETDFTFLPSYKNFPDKKHNKANKKKLFTKFHPFFSTEEKKLYIYK